MPAQRFVVLTEQNVYFQLENKMKIRTLLAATLLSLALSATVFAGEMQVPGYVPPPPPQESTAQNTGDMQGPGFTTTDSQDAIVNALVSAGMSIVSLF